MILKYSLVSIDLLLVHGWDYRRYANGVSKISSPREEFDYTTLKINQNFSNFSAWHYRSKLMAKAFDPSEYSKIIEEGTRKQFISLPPSLLFGEMCPKRIKKIQFK